MGITFGISWDKTLIISSNMLQYLTDGNFIHLFNATSTELDLSFHCTMQESSYGFVQHQRSSRR